MTRGNGALMLTVSIGVEIRVALFRGEWLGIEDVF